MKEYKGTVASKDTDILVKKAYTVYIHQKSRCSCVTDSRYKNYGAKGISVEYSAREFIAWYLDNIKTFKGKRPSVGRIDHNRNYSFDNIEMQSTSDNTKERLKRVGNPKPKKPILCIDYKTKEPLMIFDSTSQASVFTGINRTWISSIINLRQQKKSSKGFSFLLI